MMESHSHGVFNENQHPVGSPYLHHFAWCRLCSAGHADPADYLRIHDEIGLEVAQAEKDLAEFQDGILKNLVQLRLETLRLNQAIIPTRLIGADVAAPAPVPSVMPDLELAARIRAEIATLDIQIEETKRQVAETKSAIVALPMARLETDKVTRAMLNGSLMRAEYGVIAPVLNEMVLPGPQKVVAAEAPPQDVQPLPQTPAVIVPPKSGFSDPNFPRVDYSYPAFKDDPLDQMRFWGWWMIGPLDDDKSYLIINQSNLKMNTGVGESVISAFCVSGISKMMVQTGVVFDNDGKDTIEVMMTPDWRAPHTATWQLEQTPDGDMIVLEGSKNILYVNLPAMNDRASHIDESGIEPLTTIGQFLSHGSNRPRWFRLQE